MLLETPNGGVRDGLGLRRRLALFQRAEDGSLLIYGMFCFVGMLMLAGVALDVMRFEERRTVLQATLDRAVLAAADMDQTLDCKAVVKDYFVKAGEAAPDDDEITCDKNDFGSLVSVTNQVDMPTWFMNIFGVDTMIAPAAGTAEERVGSVEISLVLDVSGSMNSNNRLINLKPAAKDFVDQMFETIETGKLSMSVITYSTQVALGDDMLQYFHTTGEHSYSTCLQFDSADFDTTTMSPKSTDPGMPAGMGDRLYQLNGHFDPFYSSLVNYSSSNTLMNCPPDNSANANRTISAFSGDPDALKAKIQSLVASGNTSIDIGVKWGAALLDPSMQPVLTRMIAAGTASDTFEGRPKSYYRTDGSINSELLKVIVLMTDGENTTEYKLRDTYDHGLSRLYMSDTTNSSYNGSSWYKRFSLYDSTRSGNKYYSFYTASWRSEPWGSQATDISGSDNPPVQLTWPEVWNIMSVNWFADQLIYRAYGNSSTERNKWRTSNSSAIATSYVGNSTKNGSVLDVCDAAKAKGVKIFTIGFEAPTGGATLLKACASSPAHYYAVAGLDIETAFKSIANSINKLRLTH
jgi:hypothetical protein